MLETEFVFTSATSSCRKADPVLADRCERTEPIVADDGARVDMRYRRGGALLRFEGDELLRYRKANGLTIIPKGSTLAAWVSHVARPESPSGRPT